MSAAPVEFRYFHRKFTLEHARAGLTPLKDTTTHELYVPYVLQYRFKVRVGSGDALVTKWSDWQDIPVVKEGAEMPVGAANESP